MERRCFICNAEEGTKELYKCPICFKLVCADCGYFYGGRWFCCESCARMFFFYDEEE